MRAGITFAWLLACACRCADEPGLLDPALDAGLADTAIAPDASIASDAETSPPDASVSLDANVCVVECVHGWEPLDDFPQVFGFWGRGAVAYDESSRRLVATDAYDNRVYTFDPDTNIWRELETQGEHAPPGLLYPWMLAAGGELFLFGIQDGIWVLNMSTASWRRIPSGAVPSLRAHFLAVDRAGKRLLALSANELYVFALGAGGEWQRFDLPNGPSALEFAYYDRGRDVMVAVEGREMRSVDLDNPAWGMLEETWPFDHVRFSTTDLADAPPVIYGSIEGAWTISRSTASGPITWSSEPAAEAMPHWGWYAYAEDRSTLFFVGEPSQQSGPTTVRSFQIGDPLEWIDAIIAITVPPDTGLPPVAVHDALRDELYVVPQFFSDHEATETWVRRPIRNAPWSKLDVALPNYDLVNATWDAAADRMILVGARFNAPRSDTWIMTREPAPEWIEIATSTPAYVTGLVLLVSDTRRARTLLYDAELGQVHELVFSATPAWTRVLTDGDPPSPRSHASAIYDASSDRLIVFGGYVPNTQYDSTFDAYALDFGLDPPRWTRMDDQPESSIVWPMAVYLPETREMMLFGERGNDAWVCDRFEELWFFDLDAASGSQWRRDGSGGVRPYFRHSHMLVETPMGPLVTGATTWRFVRDRECAD